MYNPSEKGSGAEMGNFGIAFEGEADTLEKVTQKLRAEAARRREQEREAIAREIREKVDRRINQKFKSQRKDGPFQKGLCWASYYTMVYAAFCNFMPGHVAAAAEQVTSLVGVDIVMTAPKPAPAPEQTAPAVQIDASTWMLRN